jgi:hypothetical protein
MFSAFFFREVDRLWLMASRYIGSDKAIADLPFMNGNVSDYLFVRLIFSGRSQIRSSS